MTGGDLAVTPLTTIREAMRVIDSGGNQIALVLDDDGRLFGTVTDGDIRRGLLAGAELDGPIESLVFRTPVTGGVGDAPETLQRVMRDKSILQLPLLDADGRVAGLELLQRTQFTQWRDNPVVIMAGGLGTRLRPLTETCPKPMLRVGGRPVLETILLTLREQGFRNFFISVNYMSEVIENYFGDGSALGVSIDYLREDKRMGTAGALGLLPARPASPLLLINGDVLTTMHFGALMDFHQKRGGDVTMCVRTYEHQVPYGVVRVQGDLLVDIQEKPVQQHFVNAGIYVLNPAALDHVPVGEYHDMTDLVPRLRETGGVCRVYQVDDYWLDIGRMADLERAECEYGEWFE